MKGYIKLQITNFFIRRLSISLESICFGSLYKRKRIRNAQAILFVSCINKFGFALPRYPLNNEEK